MELFFILTVVAVTEVCIFVKTHQAVHLNGCIRIVRISIAIKLIKIMNKISGFFLVTRAFPAYCVKF